MEITTEFLKEVEKEAMSKTLLPTIAIKSGKGNNNIPAAFRDNLSDQYIGYEKIIECEETGNFLVIDFESNNVTVYSLNEKEKMLEDYNNKVTICNWNTPLNVYNIIETEYGPVLFIRTLWMQSFYAYTPRFIKHINAKNIINASKWVMYFRDGSVYANFVTSADGREGYFAWNYGLKGRLQSSGIIKGIEDPIDVYGHTYGDIYNMYISKVLPRTVYLGTECYYNTSVEPEALFVASWSKEPKMRSGKKQRVVDEYSKLNVIENDVAKKALQRNKDLVLTVTSGYSHGEKGIIYKLDSDKNILLIKRFLIGESEEHSRVYIDDKDVYYAFKNREKKWCSLPISKKHNKQFRFSIDFFSEYEEDIFKGTLLEYTYPKIRDAKEIFKDYMSEGEKVYAFTRTATAEEFLNSGIIKKLRIDDPKPGMAEQLFGKLDNKKKGLYQRLGVTKKQLEMMADMVTRNTEDLSARSEKEGYPYMDNVFNYSVQRQFGQLVEYFKMVFSNSGLEYDKKKEIVNISNIDEETFEKILNIFKSLSIKFEQSSYELGYSKTYGRAIAELLAMFKAHYSNKAFLNFIDYVAEIANKTIEVRIDRYSGDFIIADKDIINYYIDYLRMLIQAQECRNFPWKFETIEEIKEAHDNFIPIFNRFMDLQKSPEVINQKIADRHDKMEKYFYNNNEFMVTYPRSGIEIIDEGRDLRHCVGSYVNKVADGHTDIFFIRKADDPKKPFFTLELQNSRVRQVHGFANSYASSVEGLVAFIKEWAKKNKIFYKPEESDRALVAN